MSGFPKGWAAVQLQDIARPERSAVNPASVSNIPYVGLEHIEAGTTRLMSVGSTADVRSTTYRFVSGSILYSRLRPYLNKVTTADFDGVGSSELIIFPPSSILATGFLKYVLNQNAFVHFAELLDTGDRPRVKWDSIKEFSFWLPPLSEQQRIVDAIEAQFSRLDTGARTLKSALVKLNVMRSVLLQMAVTGHLVEQDPDEGCGKDLLEGIELRRSVRRRSKKGGNDLVTHLPTLPSSWATAAWAAIGTSQNGKAFPSSDYSQQGTRLLRPGNLNAAGHIEWTSENTKRLPDRYAEESSSYLVGPSEIVMNLTAQSLKDEFLGRVCMTDDEEPMLLNQRLARLTPIEMNPRYIFWVLKSPIFRRFVGQLNKGSLIQHMFTTQLDQFVFPVPPRAEQDRIVERLEAILSQLNRIRIAIDVNQRRVPALRSATLDAAFTGRLVMQDPSDEPASALVERIAKEWSGGVTNPRSRKARTPRAKVTR